MNDELFEITKDGCLLYLKNWVGILKEQISDGDPKSRLYEEQMVFLKKAIEEMS